MSWSWCVLRMVVDHSVRRNGRVWPSTMNQAALTPPKLKPSVTRLRARLRGREAGGAAVGAVIWPLPLSWPLVPLSQ